MKRTYPFDPNIKHHLIIALGFAIWTFVFLFFTEPLEIFTYSKAQKINYLPLYAIFGAVSYLIILPFQKWLFLKNKQRWFLYNELLIFCLFLTLGFISIYPLFNITVSNDKIAFLPLYGFFSSFFIPAVFTLFPIIIISRWLLGRYYEKNAENQKIEIKGEGNYENLKLFFNDLIYVQASDNYVDVHYLESNFTKNSLIRTKLSNITNSFPELLQVHRSYLINMFHYKHYKIQKGKHYLVLKNDILIPVSKTYLENVKRKLNFTTN